MAGQFEDLKALNEMLQRGEITEAEYQVVKKELLEPADDPSQSAPPPPRHVAATAPEVESAAKPPPGSSPLPYSTPKKAKPLYLRTWFWLIAGIGVLLVVVNLGSGSGNGSPNPTSASPNPTSAFSGGSNCAQFLGSISAFATDSSDVMNSSVVVMEDVLDGSVSFTEGAASLRRSADQLDRIDRQIAALGTPPATVTATTRLFRRALDELARGYNTAATGIQSQDPTRLDDAFVMITAGNALITEATDAIEPCP